MTELERLIQLLAKLPGLGPRSARRAALHLLKKRESLMQPLAASLTETSARVRPCSLCGNLDTADPCAICADPRRDPALLCVVEDLIVAAHADARRKAEVVMQEKMEGVTGGLPLPPGMKLPF